MATMYQNARRSWSRSASSLMSFTLMVGLLADLCRRIRRNRKRLGISVSNSRFRRPTVEQMGEAERGSTNTPFTT
jgi:hypothetical protein